MPACMRANTLVFQHANAGSDGLMTHSHTVSHSLPPFTRAVMDCVSSAFGIYKIETIGDSYMAAGGLFRGSSHEGQEDVCLTVDMAFAMCVRYEITVDMAFAMCVRYEISLSTAEEFVRVYCLRLGKLSDFVCLWYFLLTCRHMEQDSSSPPGGHPITEVGLFTRETQGTQDRQRRARCEGS